MRASGGIAAMAGLTLVLTACGADSPVTGGDGSDAPNSAITIKPGEPVAATTREAEPSAEPTPSGTTGPATDEQPTAEPTTRAHAVDTSRPDHVIGDGTAASCTSAAVVEAVAAGGIITFDCGPDPVTIVMSETAKIRNDTGPEIVLDGGGDVTLSGDGARRILYMNTCDQDQVWTTSHCQNQDHPRLTVQNLTFVDGDSTGETAEGGGGGAIFVRGGRLAIVNSHFESNRCDPSGPDVGGAAVRVLSQYDGRPVHVVDSTFRDGECSNGGALSSIGVSWEISGSVLTGNSAIGNGANPARDGTPGGGSGGAIYTDGNDFTVTIVDTVIEDNHANEGGGAIFFVSNDRTGTMRIEDSILQRNPSDGFETDGMPGIFFLGAEQPSVTGSTLQ